MRIHRDHLIGLGRQLLVVSADQHQPLLGPFAHHQPNPFSSLGIQKSRWFIEHLEWLFGEVILCLAQTSDVEQAVEGAQPAQ